MTDKLSRILLLSKFSRWLVICTAVLFVAMPVASALSQSDYESIINGTPFYDSHDTACTATTFGIATAVNQTTTWNSGLQPPYILEQFAIQTLKDVAQKMNVPESSTVTQEHVIALVAFMFGEGGDIANNDVFNPLNTGLNDPTLVSGAAHGDGTQSFVSFDAGVEATARTLVGSNQSRLAAALIQPQSTAEQFMYALTYYDKYDGNQYWAQASAPPNQDKYYQQRLNLVQQVRSKYADIAGIIIGTPDFEELKNETDKSLLTYHPAGDQSSTTDIATITNANAGCGGGIVAGSIVNTALGLAWPSIGHGNQKEDATAAYQSAMPLYNGSTGDLPYSDCGVFVSTVMIASGTDPNYPKRGTSIQQQYILDHPELYQTFTNVTDTKSLQPGDIFVNSQHTFIFVGTQSNGYNSVAASLHDHVPQATNASFSENGEPFLVARFIGNRGQ